ncbi:hypothetical protein [Hyalangium rubrum]|uniref:Uncharacterized protein n=1 Tax=Hyalangium rubrum TaxID=3103134 RepID=A0ABU5H7N2_9BACT|nr:hypothetical protein [Hyalangium sp. s54d21]MDY7229478.1 hypothetical protein [Hyalangium sp. s54d21]
MSPLNPWVASALEQLAELEQESTQGPLDPDTALRVLVLRARLAQARAAGIAFDLPESLEALATKVAPTATQPEPLLYMPQLKAQLASTDTPFGELLDVLLEFDDAATVDDLQGRAGQARALMFQVSNAVWRAPARVAELREMAENRLATLPDEASSRLLWETIERAARRAAGNREAKPRPPKSLRQDVSSAPLLTALHRAAASDLGTASREPFSGGAVEIYAEDGDILILVELPPGLQAVGAIELQLSAQDRTITWELPISHHSKRAIIARLGKAEHLRERLRREGLNLPLEEARWQVTVKMEESGE